jgi:hypothetical protein
VAIFGCVFGIGLVVLGFELVSRSPNNEGPAVANLSTEAHNKKPPRAWNIALGHVVIVAPELGLGATALKENNVDQEKIVARITGQLQSLREIYRQESEKNPALMGGMMLQLTIAPSGEVTHVKEIASRIADSDFKKLVIAEASRWSFQEVVSESLTINCPLLFVREGMDITTVVQWEKSLGQFAGKNTETQKYRPPIQQSKTAAAPMAVSVPLKPDWAKSENAAPIPRAKPVIAAYQIRHATSLRREPNFASSTVAKLPEGMKINMIGERGDWLEVRSDDASLLGFVRKEFVSPFDMARR